jgi:carboxyl-terminal processing protease
MKRKMIVLFSILTMISFLLSSCIGLIPLEKDESVTGGYGPQVSLQEHQTQTFDALWTIMQDNYIYYDTANVDWDILHEKYQAEIDKELSAEEFDSLLRELEADLPESSILYQSRMERIESDIADTSTYEGIGAFIGFNLEPEPHIVLLSIIDGSPAEKAGLKAHDSIFAIDGNPISSNEGVNAVQRVRGPAGSTVTLTVQSPGGAMHEVQVQRGKLAANARLEAFQVTGTKYGYLLFPPITYDNLLQDVIAAMQTFTTNQNLDGLIIDLRIAGSSGSWPLESLYTMFYNGEIGEFYNRLDRQILQVEGQDVFSSQSVPLVILVGKNTQGFPEILAGGLQLNQRAIIVGETTSGRIESSTGYFLPDGSRVYIETTSFVLSNGDEIGLNGVKPNIQIEAGWDEILATRDPVLDAAVQQLEQK